MQSLEYPIFVLLTVIYRLDVYKFCSAILVTTSFVLARIAITSVTLNTITVKFFIVVHTICTFSFTINFLCVLFLFPYVWFLNVYLFWSHVIFCIIFYLLFEFLYAIFFLGHVCHVLENLVLNLDILFEL